MEHHIRSVSRNYTRTAYILQLDIRGYFMREKLYYYVWELLNRCCEEELRDMNLLLIDDLLVKIILRNPVERVHILGSPDEWKGLPDNKSLFKSPPGVGLPIGDLTSQLFSNVYLNKLDQFIKRELKMRHYGRYVDDFFLMHSSREVLENSRLLGVVPWTGECSSWKPSQHAGASEVKETASRFHRLFGGNLQNTP